MQNELKKLITQARERKFGKYRGFVVDNQDPENLGRLQLLVPSVLGEAVSHWALPCTPFGGMADQGWFMMPEIDAQIWAEFEEGNVNKPIWSGMFWQQDADVPTEGTDKQPDVRLFKTPSGHLLAFDDTKEEEAVLLQHRTGAGLAIDKDGTVRLKNEKSSLTMDATSPVVEIVDGNGNTITLESSGISVNDANGNSVAMSGSGVTISSSATISIEGSSIQLGGVGGEPLIKGQSFLGLFATHVHTSSPSGGPTTPPLPQGEMSTLSTTSTVK